MQIGATPDDRSAVASRAATLLQRNSDHPRACGELGTNLTPRCSFSAIVQILKSLTDFPDSGVDDLEPFRTAGDQRVKSLALLHTLADPLILLARRGTVAVTGSARNGFGAWLLTLTSAGIVNRLVLLPRPAHDPAYEVEGASEIQDLGNLKAAPFTDLLEPDCTSEKGRVCAPPAASVAMNGTSTSTKIAVERFDVPVLPRAARLESYRHNRSFTQDVRVWRETALGRAGSGMLARSTEARQKQIALKLQLVRKSPGRSVHVQHQLGVSERRACRVLSQARSTHRHRPVVPDDEPRLVARLIELATLYGRYGYRRITGLLRGEGWTVNHKCIERLWRREGLKVPQKQPKRGRLWLADGSCIRRRPESRHHVWAYDFVADRTHDGRPLKILTIVEEYSRECLTIVVARWVRSIDVLETLAELFVMHGVPAHIRSTTARSSRQSSSGSGSRPCRCRRCSSSRAAHGRPGTSNRSTASCGMNCWTGRSSTRSRKPRSCSRDGGGSTTRCGRTVRWAIDPQRLKRSCRHRLAG